MTPLHRILSPGTARPGRGGFRAFVLLVLLPVTALAQSVRWNPPGGQLGFNQVSQISLTFENCEPDGSPGLPRIDGLVVGQPSQSTETSMVNFHVTSRFSLVYPVRPTQKTNIVIPGFTVKTDKGSLTVAAATFTVGAATVGSAGTGPALDDVASAQLETPQATYWAGEVFPVTFNLSVVRRYYHSLATNVDWTATPLVTEDWSKPDLKEALVRGERSVVSLQNTRAYAKEPGIFTVKPATQMVNLMVQDNSFNIFSQASVEQRAITTKPLTLTIQPLPPAPTGFSGAVGEFTFTSKVIPTTAAIGEPITWTVELTGTGNWPDITGLPQREVSNDFQVVQPKSQRTMKDNALFEGRLSEDVVLVPGHAGTYQLAPVRFTYFDTKTGGYRTIASDPVSVTITAAAAPTLPGATGATPGQPSLNLGAAAPALPAAVPPVAPENLPRDPLGEPHRGLVPQTQPVLVAICLFAPLFCVLTAWLTLAALRSRRNDPQLRRREARRQLAAALASLRSAPAIGEPLRRWQQHATALWEVPHAAPGASLVQTCVAAHQPAAAADWAKLWSEADRALHSRENNLPRDWLPRAESALGTVRVPDWAPFSLFGARNLLPFLFTLALLLSPLALHADMAADAYKQGDFAAAEKSWQKTVAASPSDWTARHNLGLALAQQDRWAEAAAQWSSAFVLNPQSDLTRWDLALGLQHSGLAPGELVDLVRGEGPGRIARLASVGGWQVILVGATLLLAAALIVLLLQGYRLIGAWAKPTALTTSLLAVLLAAAATLSLHTYGPLTEPAAAMVWRTSILRSIPTEADTTQKTSALAAGSLAAVEKTFLGWTKLSFPGGQTGWVRSEDVISLYR